VYNLKIGFLHFLQEHATKGLRGAFLLVHFHLHSHVNRYVLLVDQPNLREMALIKRILAFAIIAGILAACGGHYCPTYGKASVTKPVKRNIARRH
jgi:hypothetical protein